MAISSVFSAFVLSGMGSEAGCMCRLTMQRLGKIQVRLSTNSMPTLKTTAQKKKNQDKKNKGSVINGWDTAGYFTPNTRNKRV